MVDLADMLSYHLQINANIGGKLESLSFPFFFSVVKSVSKNNVASVLALRLWGGITLKKNNNVAEGKLSFSYHLHYMFLC